MRLSVKLTIMVASVLVALLLGWGVEAALLLGLLAASVAGVVTYRLSTAIGLTCLACCPLLLLIDRSAVLQQSPLVNYYIVSTLGAGIYSPSRAVDAMATQAYYFLGIGALALLVRSALAVHREARR